MGKASRTKQAPDRRARIAAQREAAKRAEQRKRIYIAGGSILAVIIVVVAFVLIKGNSNGSGSSGSNGPTGAALTTLTHQVTTVPVSTQDGVGAGNIASSNFITSSGIASASAADTSYFATVNGSPLTSGGKPEVLYVGAEYCPFCAAQRWAMIVSLSRFGTFSGLSTIHSSSTDIYPNTPTFTFYGSKYTSKYVTFTPVEETTVTEQPLQNPTAAQQALVAKYDPGTSQGSPIPFIDVGNKYVQVGNLTQYSPSDLAGKSWSQVAAALTQPSSTIAKGILGSANYMTAGICTLTNNQPASACTPAIKALEGNFAS